MARVNCPFRPSRMLSLSLSLLLPHVPSLEQGSSAMSSQVIILSVSGKPQDPIFLYWQVLMFTFKGRKQELQVQAKFLNTVLRAMQCSEYFNFHLAP